MLRGCLGRGDVLVFANQRPQVEYLTNKLKARGFRWGCCFHCVWPMGRVLHCLKLSHAGSNAD